MTAREIIEILSLTPHPEGGYYKESYRSDYNIPVDVGEIRSVCTAIYFLLMEKDRSLFHRIKSDELWFFHLGEPLIIFWIESGELRSVILGPDIRNGEVMQACIPANAWFGSKLKNENGFSLVSCTVSPGFDFADFELADRKQLLLELPGLEEVIHEFTKA